MASHNIDDLSQVADMISVSTASDANGVLLRIDHPSLASRPMLRTQAIRLGADGSLTFLEDAKGRTPVGFDPVDASGLVPLADGVVMPLAAFPGLSVPSVALHLAARDIGRRLGLAMGDLVAMHRSVEGLAAPHVAKARDLLDLHVSPRMPEATARTYLALSRTGAFDVALFDRIRALDADLRDRVCSFVTRNPVHAQAILATVQGWDAVLRGATDMEAFRAARDAAQVGVDPDLGHHGRGQVMSLARWSDAHFAKVARLGHDFSARGRSPAHALDVLPDLPLEWVPRAEDMEAFGRVLTISRSVAAPTFGDSRVAMAGCGGDWQAYARRLAAALGPMEGEAATPWVGPSGASRDVAQHFMRDVAMPVAVMNPLLAPRLLAHLREVLTKVGPPRSGSRLHAMLFAGMDLPGLCSMLARHREARPAIVGVISRNRPDPVGKRRRAHIAAPLRSADGSVIVTDVRRSASAEASPTDERDLVTVDGAHVLLKAVFATTDVDGAAAWDRGEMACAVRLPARTFEGSVVARLSVRLAGNEVKDLSRSLAETLGCHPGEVGDALLARLGLARAHALPEDETGEGYVSGYTSIALAEGAVQAMLRAWRDALPRRYRVRAGAEVAVLLESDYVEAVARLGH